MSAKSEHSEKSTATDASPDSAIPDFETSLNELEQLVDQMEQGELTLEQSLQHFERGIKLTKTCQQALKEAELKVQQLLGDGELVPFDRDDE